MNTTPIRIETAEARAVAKGACAAVRQSRVDLLLPVDRTIPSSIRDILDQAVRALDAWEAGGG